MADAIKQSLRKFDLSCFTSGLALSLTVSGVPDYQSVRRIADGVAQILKEADDTTGPLYLTLDLDLPSHSAPFQGGAQSFAGHYRDDGTKSAIWIISISANAWVSRR